MKRTVFFTFMLSAILLVACSTSVAPAGEVVGKTVSVDGGVYTDVSAAELQTMLAAKDFTFVNVHIPFAGDIPDTDLSIPFDQIEAYQDQLPADKDAKIVIYCRSGSVPDLNWTRNKVRRLTLHYSRTVPLTFNQAFPIEFN